MNARRVKRWPAFGHFVFAIRESRENPERVFIRRTSLGFTVLHRGHALATFATHARAVQWADWYVRLEAIQQWIRGREAVAR